MRSRGYGSQLEIEKIKKYIYKRGGDENGWNFWKNQTKIGQNRQ
jgi:hypothetical protein